MRLCYEVNKLFEAFGVGSHLFWHDILKFFVLFITLIANATQFNAVNDM